MKTDVVILTMARSRSSLVSHLLYRHGVQSGFCKPPDECNRVPYHENRKLKKLIHRARCNEKIYDTLTPTHIDGFLPQFIKTKNEVYPDGPWLVKVDAFCWPLFIDLNPTYVKLYRDPDGIMSSIKKTPFMRKQGYTEEGWRKIIKAHHDEMDKIDGFAINTDKMLTDYTELKAVIEYLDLDFNPDIPLGIINCNEYQYL